MVEHGYLRTQLQANVTVLGNPLFLEPGPRVPLEHFGTASSDWPSRLGWDVWNMDCFGMIWMYFDGGSSSATHYSTMKKGLFWGGEEHHDTFTLPTFLSLISQALGNGTWISEAHPAPELRRMEGEWATSSVTSCYVGMVYLVLSRYVYRNRNIFRHVTLPAFGPRVKASRCGCGRPGCQKLWASTGAVLGCRILSYITCSILVGIDFIPFSPVREWFALETVYCTWTPRHCGNHGVPAASTVE